MKYLEARPDIKSGDLLAFSHSGWWSWHDIKILLVRMFCRSEYSHVAIAWVVGGRVFAIEAVEPKARIFPLSKLGDFYWLRMSAPWSEKAEETALAHIGDNYSEITAMRAFFAPLDKGNTEECAALAITIAAADGINLGRRATPDAVVKAAQLIGAPLYYVENP